MYKKKYVAPAYLSSDKFGTSWEEKNKNKLKFMMPEVLKIINQNYFLLK